MFWKPKPKFISYVALSLGNFCTEKQLRKQLIKQLGADKSQVKKVIEFFKDGEDRVGFVFAHATDKPFKCGMGVQFFHTMMIAINKNMLENHEFIDLSRWVCNNEAAIVTAEAKDLLISKHDLVNEHGVPCFHLK